MASKKKPQEMLLVASKTKSVLKDMELNVSGDALDSLNDMVYYYLDQAGKRAAANGRKTVRGHDFSIMD